MNDLLTHHKAWAAYWLAVVAERQAGVASEKLVPDVAAADSAVRVGARQRLVEEAIGEHERHLVRAKQYEAMSESEAAE